MPALNTHNESFHLAHGNFTEAYKMVNEYVTELYLLPKMFLDETWATMDKLTTGRTAPHHSEKTNKPLAAAVKFMDQLDEFTVQTIALFNQHMKHIDATEVYMRKVTLMKAKHIGKNLWEHETEYAALSPELNKLMDGLREIKLNADDTLVRLESLEIKWEDIQVNLKHAA